MAASKEVLKVNDLTIARGDKTIIRNLTWGVRKGEHWVILGGNGSGKTSLLSALVGYLPPTDGEVYVFGEKYGETDWRELRHAIGMVSSSVRQLMNDSETVLESVVSGKYAMIDYWGRVSSADRAAARKIMRVTEIASIERRPWLYLSQGERQRVLMARALMAQPAILILDEPCAGLDPVARESFLSFLERYLQKPGAPSVVFVTHHVEEILPVMTHVLLLREGQALAQGPLRQIVTSSLLTQTFGARATVARRQGRYALKMAPHQGKVF